METITITKEQSNTLNELVTSHDLILEEGSDHSEPEEIPIIEAQHQEYMSLKSATTFRDDVRNEWINAVFGNNFPDCMEKTNKPQQGMGLGQIAMYTAYTATIRLCDAAEKMLGISISRLSLGLYVRHVELGSDAWCAGIVTNSVLVSINGMCLLAEPSKQALERLWQYEGHLHLEQINQTTTTTSSTSKIIPTAASLSNRQPLHMTFIYQGRLYSVVLLSNPPYGIDWAPCGNFALVKRSHGYAQEAGVLKGSIIASINSTRDIHELDHTLAATTLRTLFNNRQEIHLTLCIPPSEARSGHFERLLDSQELNAPSTTPTSTQITPRKIQRPQVAAELDGVEVRVHPILFTAGSPQSNPVSNAAMNLSQLAFRVAAGELFSFPRRRRFQYLYSQRYYRSCPPLDRALAELLTSNHSLLYVLAYDKANYDETKMGLGRFLDCDENNLALSFLRQFSQRQVHKAVDTFLLQILSVLRIEDPNGSPSPLSEFLLITCKNHIDLCHRMEFMVQSQGLTYLKAQLTILRNQRLNQRREPRQIPIRVEKVPDSPDAAASIVTGTTASVMTMSSIISGTNTDEGTAQTKRFLGFFRKKKKSWNRKKRLSANVDHKTKAGTSISTKASGNRVASCQVIPSTLPPRVGIPSPPVPKDVLFTNTLSFLEELEAVCMDVEKSLLRSFSQKIAGWALQPWSASKETELAQVTQVMRERLRNFSTLPLLNPIDSQTLVSVDVYGSYILPSAHFPLLLTFDCQDRNDDSSVNQGIYRDDRYIETEAIYRTKVELVDLVGKSLNEEESAGRTFFIHGAVGGKIVKSGAR